MNNKLVVNPGDILSESSHYRVTNVIGNLVKLLHYEGNMPITLTHDYINKYTKSADYFSSIITVTKEDTVNGELGIRSIFEMIKSHQVFTVCFTKQESNKTKKQLAEDVNKFSDEIFKIADCYKRRKGTFDKEALTKLLIENPITHKNEGEERILRGFKVEFASRDGRYDCIDMDIEVHGTEKGIRPVNINTIKWLIINDTKYIVE